MADPLKLLREYALGRRPLKEVKQGNEQFIVFGDVAFRRDVKTNHRIYGRPNEYYTLESLLVFWNKRELVHTAYVKEAAGLAVVPVSRPDRFDSLPLFAVLECARRALLLLSLIESMLIVRFKVRYALW